MKKWVLKALIQKAISFLPYKHQINYLFQKYVTKGVQLSEYYFEDRLTHFENHLGFYNKYKGAIKGKAILELGTGWYPVIPLGFFLAGAERIHTVDISALMDKPKLGTTLNRYLDYIQDGKLNYLNFEQDRLDLLEEIIAEFDQLELSEVLQKLRINYLVEDARKLPLPSDTVHLITSNNTFEHVYPEILEGILREFVRVLSQDGLMSHFIDMSDHFAHLDQTITIYNFLQFSERQWQWIDNTIQPQNRWRISHFRALYAAQNIPITEEKNRPGDLSALNTVKVHPIYAAISRADLAISHSYMVSSY